MGYINLHREVTLLKGEVGLSSTHALRQIGLMVGLVTSVAIGAAIVLSIQWHCSGA